MLFRSEAMPRANTVSSHIPTKGDLVAAARALIPALRERADESEDLRRLPDVTVSDLKAAGLHKIYMPRRFGGWEMDWGAHMEVSREISQACGSAGWITGLVFSHVMWVARFGAEAQEEFFAANPEPLVATGSAGGGSLTETEGGYELTGRWGFTSGINHANGAMVTAKLGDGPVFTHFVLLQPEEWTNEGNWLAEGLRGTGSHHIRVAGARMPAHRVITMQEMLSPNPPGSQLHDSYIYKVRPAAYQKSWFAGILVGTAMGALQEYAALTKTRKGALFGESIVDQVPVQVRVGEAAAEIHAANLIVENFCQLLHDRGAAEQDIMGKDLLSAKRDMTFASRLCLKAAERLSGMMGVSAQTGRNPVQRHFRDCRTVTTHIELQWDHSMAPTGKYLLEVPTGDPLIDGADSSAENGNARLGARV
jgi:3-hydroxy-9,10-secoandrosta-1,3,5(10)-triene-9,17-dione monooxygenase